METISKPPTDTLTDVSDAALLRLSGMALADRARGDGEEPQWRPIPVDILGAMAAELLARRKAAVIADHALEQIAGGAFGEIAAQRASTALICSREIVAEARSKFVFPRGTANVVTS